LHLLCCPDLECAESICVAARRYDRVWAAVKVADSAKAVREFFASKLPLDRLQLAVCPGCGAELLVTARRQIQWERSEQGEPAALTCGCRCAAKVAAELAGG
jgi:hypothetical protein